jgi:hypothetical protein
MESAYGPPQGIIYWTAVDLKGLESVARADAPTSEIGHLRPIKPGGLFKRAGGFAGVSGGGAARRRVSTQPSPARAQTRRPETYEYDWQWVREIRIRDAAGAFRVM